MEIYSGPYLKVNYESQNNRFINSWKSSPNTTNEFKEELLHYLSALEKVNPTQIIWLQQNFTFHIDDQTKLWVEENILKPRYKAGFIKEDKDGHHPIAFVVGKDVLSHMEVMGVFDEPSPSVFNPKHFATEQEANDWLNKEFPYESTTNIRNTEIIFKGLDDDGNAIIEFKEAPYEISNTLKAIKNILDENNFMKENIEKFSSLTKREKETFQLIIKGKSNEQIAKEMHISLHTVRTHRNRVWKKLKITHFIDCLKYKSFFN